MTIEEKREAVEDENHEFDSVIPKRATHRDVHALVLLDKLFPKAGVRMIARAEHDQVWFAPSAGAVASLSDEAIIELARCGVFYDDDVESLSMFI